RSLPPPPPGARYVGNVYCIEAVLPATAAGSSSPSPLDTTGQPLMAAPGQVLLRVPPVPYNSVRVGWGGAWHATEWGAQADSANLTLDHLGDVATFVDTTKPTPRSPVGVVEVAGTVLAIA